MLNESGESDQIYLNPNLKWEAFRFSLLCKTLPVGSISTLMPVFVMNECEFPKCLIYIYWDKHLGFFSSGLFVCFFSLLL